MSLIATPEQMESLNAQRDRLQQRIRKLSVVLPDGCWEWRSGKTKIGYGRLLISMPGRSVFLAAHRVAAFAFLGFDMTSLWNVLHKCDKRDCVNPEHFFIGSQLANQQDAAAKGRMTHGERHRCAILTEEKVRKIRALREQGLLLREISELMSVSVNHVSVIARKAAWRHVV